MTNEREPKFCIAAAEKGGGKTWYTEHTLIDNYVKGNPKLGVPPRKVIVVDINNEYPYKTIPVNEDTINIFNMQPVFEARKVSVLKKDGSRKTPDELKQDLNIILKCFRNGLLVVEDINKIVNDNVSGEIFGFLCTNRHVDLDIYINIQNIGKAGHPKLKATMNILRLHHVKEDVRRHEQKFEDYIHILRIAQLIVNARYNLGLSKIRELERKGIYKGDKTYDYWNISHLKFYVFVNFDDNLISGSFTKDEFKKAIAEYIYENEKSTIRPYLSRRDPATGKTLYNYQTAFSKATEDLTNQHYGNND